jgi:hypothetical protein
MKSPKRGSVNECALSFLLCCLLGLVPILSYAPSPLDLKSLAIKDWAGSLVPDHSFSRLLRRETIRGVAGVDRRWTREACKDHWAAGIERVAFGKLADKRILLAINMKDTEQGEVLVGAIWKY